MSNYELKFSNNTQINSTNINPDSTLKKTSTATKEELLSKLFALKKSASEETLPDLKEHQFQPKKDEGNTTQLFKQNAYGYKPKLEIEQARNPYGKHSPIQSNSSLRSENDYQHSNLEMEASKESNANNQQVQSNFYWDKNNAEPTEQKPKSIYETIEKIRTIPFTLKDAHLLAAGNSKTAYLQSLQNSPHEFKHIKTLLKNSKEEVQLGYFMEIRNEVQSLKSIFGKTIKKVSRVIFKNPLEIAHDKSFTNTDTSQAFLHDIKKMMAYASPMFHNNEMIRNQYPAIEQFLEKNPSLLNMISLHQALPSSQERHQFFKELHLFFENEQIKVVAAIPKNEKKLDEETQKANLVQRSLKNISNPFKKYVAVPLIFMEPGSKIMGLLDRFYNLGDVQGLITKNALTKDEKYDVLIQSAQGLSCLHEAQVVHCDFAARNVLLKNQINGKGEYTVKVGIADFGLAQPVGTKWDGDKETPLLWTSPERLLSREMSAKSDTWSYGVFLLEMMQPKDLILPGKSIFLETIFGNHVEHVKKVMIDFKDTDHPTNLRMEEALDQYEKNSGWVMDARVKNILLSCFANQAEDRPSLLEISNQLQALKDQNVSLEFMRK